MAKQGKSNSKTKPARVPFIGSRSKIKSEFKTPYWRLSYDFPYNPDPLCSGNSYDEYDDMRKDDQVKSVLTVKKDMVVNTGYKITGERDDVNEFVQKNLEHINETSGLDSTFTDILREMLTSYDYGFSMTEPVFKIEDSMYYYSSMKTRAPHGFLFHMDKYGNIEKVSQMTSEGEKDFPSSTFIHHTYNPEFGNPYGNSDLQAAYKPWKAKIFFEKFFAIYVERFASGTFVSKYNKNASPDEIDEIQKIVKTIQNATALAIPENTTLDILEKSNDSSNIYLNGINHFNRQIARSVLVPDLMGLGGSETKGGSYSLGREQIGIFLGSIKKDRDSLAKKVNMKIVRPLVLANFGDYKCQFEFIPYTKEDILEYVNIFLDAAKYGIIAPTTKDLEFFRSIIGFPEGQEPGDEVNRDGQKKIQSGGTSVDKSKDKKQDKKEEEPEDHDDVDVDKNARYYRELTTYEKKVDFDEVQDMMVQAPERFIPELKRLGKAVYASIIDQIEKGKMLQKFKPDKIRRIRPRNTASMAVSLRNYYNEIYKRTRDEAQKELFPNGTKMFALDLDSDEYADLLKEEAFRNIDDYSIVVTKEGQNILVQSITDGIGEKEALDIMKESMASSSEQWIQTVVRTKTTEIFNEARKRYWENDPLAKQIVEAYQWSSILDNRTSEICRYMDGKIFKVGELSDWLKPPAHFNCRSLLVPITKFEDYKEDPKSDFNPGKLTKKGGGLLRPGKSKNVAKFQVDNKPVIMNTITTSEFGDETLVASPGPGKRIEVISISTANMDIENPVVVGFRDAKEEELRWKSLLAKAGGKYLKDFSQDHWILTSDTSLIINQTATVQVETTVEYIITDMEGNRVR